MESETQPPAIEPPAAAKAPCLPIASVVLALIAVYVGFTFLLVILELTGRKIGSGILAQIMTFAPNVLAFFGIPWWIARGRGMSMKELYGLSVHLPGEMLRGIGWGVLAQIVSAFAIGIIAYFSPDAADHMGDPARELVEGLTLASWAVLAVQLVVITPIIEELFFRGLLFRAIRCRTSVVVGALIASAIFALFHFQLLQTPILFALGLLLVWRAQKTGRLGESIFAHATFNLITSIGLFVAQSTL